MASINTERLRERFGRFQVLIKCRQNNHPPEDDPEIQDTKGNKIYDSIVTSSIKRGNHDITNDMVFKSNPGFIFHDSCGFEAGSEDEFESMNNLSQNVQMRRNWRSEYMPSGKYCIPMDDPWRTFQRSEEKSFLECDTGHIPVVVVFTKFEALRPIAFGETKKDVRGLSGEERSKRIAQQVEEVFMKTGVLNRLCDPKNRARPKSHVRLDNMDKPNTNCNILLEHTSLALDNEELQFCLISTQQSNLGLCIKCAVANLVDRAHSPFYYELDQLDIAKWFPQLHFSIDNSSGLGPRPMVKIPMACCCSPVDRNPRPTFMIPMLKRNGGLNVHAYNNANLFLWSDFVEYPSLITHFYVHSSWIFSCPVQNYDCSTDTPSDLARMSTDGSLHRDIVILIQFQLLTVLVD
ncbi:hypothetical protein BDR04DRAFT_1117168 [Suillus decipiens]|nr:hypothetical protein BDR04DRAFT_1117168 [Suillus decipiens]